MSLASTNSGLMKEDDAPVSIKNFKFLPNGEEIFMYGSTLPCLLISMYPVCRSRLICENPVLHENCGYHIGLD